MSKKKRMVNLIQASNINVSRQGNKILENVSVVVGDHDFLTVIGPNGAGKTSALNVLTGKLPYTSGYISWGGRSMEGRRPFGMTRIGIGRKLQVPSIFPELTIRQNLDIALWVNKLKLHYFF